MNSTLTHSIANDPYEQVTQLAAVIRQGGTIGQTLDVTPRECEVLYTVGHNLYEQARYNEAFKIFSLLVMINHLNDRYLMALASTSQLLGRYQDALGYYATVTLMRLDDPAPLFHSAECLLALSQVDAAINTLELLLNIDSDPDSRNTTTQRARALLPLLQERALKHDTHTPNAQ